MDTMIVVATKWYSMVVHYREGLVKDRIVVGGGGDCVEVEG